MCGQRMMTLPQTDIRARRDRVFELRTLSTPTYQIADILNVSKHTIQSDLDWWRRYLGVETRTPLQELTDRVWEDAD